MSDQHGHTGGTIGGDLTTSVKTKPTDPQHGRADHDNGGVVRGTDSMGEVGSWADRFGEDERGNTCGRMHDYAARQIQRAGLHHPSTAPDPVGYRRVNDDEPEGGKEHHGAKLEAFDERADNQAGRDDRERHLKHDEDGFGESAAVELIDGDTFEEQVLQIADPRVAIGESQAVEASDPKDRRQAG